MRDIIYTTYFLFSRLVHYVYANYRQSILHHCKGNTDLNFLFGKREEAMLTSHKSNILKQGWKIRSTLYDDSSNHLVVVKLGPC